MLLVCPHLLTDSSLHLNNPYPFCRCFQYCGEGSFVLPATIWEYPQTTRPSYLSSVPTLFSEFVSFGFLSDNRHHSLCLSTLIRSSSACLSLSFFFPQGLPEAPHLVQSCPAPSLP